MNLVKNGTVLLAALSVFAMTSCNKGDTKKEIDRATALAWVSEHYKATEEIGLKEVEQKWDYTKNVKKDTLPDDFPGGFGGYDGDALTQYALKGQYGIIDPSKKTGKENTEDISKSGADGYIFRTPLNKDNFEERYQEEEKVKFYLLNNKVLVTSETKEREFEGYINYTYTDERTFDENGYGQKQTQTIHSDKVKLTNSTDEKEYDLGKLHLVVTISKVA